MTLLDFFDVHQSSNSRECLDFVFGIPLASTHYPDMLLPLPTFSDCRIRRIRSSSSSNSPSFRAFLRHCPSLFWPISPFSSFRHFLIR
jgi:hypothetical protein